MGIMCWISRMWRSVRRCNQMNQYGGCESTSRPSTANTPDSTVCGKHSFSNTEELRVSELQYNLSLSSRTVVRIIQGLGLHTACAWWVPHHKGCHGLIVTTVCYLWLQISGMHCHRDEACLSPYPQRQSMERKYCGSPQSKVVNSAGNVINTMFWGLQKLVDFMHQGAAFSADAYSVTLEQFKGCHEK